MGEVLKFRTVDDCCLVLARRVTRQAFFQAVVDEEDSTSLRKVLEKEKSLVTLGLKRVTLANYPQICKIAVAIIGQKQPETSLALHEVGKVLAGVRLELKRRNTDETIGG